MCIRVLVLDLAFFINFNLKYLYKTKNFALPIKKTKIICMDMYGNSNCIKIKINIYNIEKVTRFQKQKIR